MDRVLQVKRISQFTIFFIILISFIIKISLEYNTYQQHIEDTINERSKQHRLLLEHLIGSLHTSYSNKTKFLFKDPNFIKHLKQNDRENLHKYLSKFYTGFKEENPYLYVMHIFDTKNVTILRMHKPTSYGDDLSNIRPIVKKVNSDKKQYHGFEVGKNGMTYRITTPIIIDNGNSIEHLGVLEFGIKPAYFLDNLKKFFEVNGAMLIKTAELKNLIFQTNYPKIHQYSLFFKENLFENLNEETYDKQILKQNNQEFIVCKDLNLKNVDNKIIAKIILADNITKLKQQYHSNIIDSIIGAAILLAIILGVLYFAFGFYTKRILVFTQQLQNINKELERKVKLRTKELEKLSITDDLTKLYNRRYFNEVFSNELSRAIRDKNSFVCIMFDIDYFKLYNDTYGHLKGDEVLINISKSVQNSLKRSQDFLFRVGGEEFCIITSNMEKDKVITYVNFIKDNIEELKIKHEKNKASQYVTASFGIAYISQVKNHLFEDKIYAVADEALYRAKTNGRNKVEIIELNE